MIYFNLLIFLLLLISFVIMVLLFAKNKKIMSLVFATIISGAGMFFCSIANLLHFDEFLTFINNGYPVMNESSLIKEVNGATELIQLLLSISILFLLLFLTAITLLIKRIVKMSASLNK